MQLTKSHLKRRQSLQNRNQKALTKQSQRRAEIITANKAVSMFAIYDKSMVELSNTLTPIEIYDIVHRATGECHASTFNLFDTGEILRDGFGRGTKQKIKAV